MKVIILCGGLGTRLREETEYKPKPMVEIGGKPILWHIMKHYSFYGYKEFILALGYKGDIIREYFIHYTTINSDFTVDLGNNGAVEIQNQLYRDDWKVTLVETGEDSMTGYRVRMCKRFILDEDFMVTYGDAVSDVDIRKLVDFHRKTNAIGTVTGVYAPSRFGDLVTHGESVEKFNQKTKDTENREPINGGYFVFKKEFLDLIPDDPEIDIEKQPIQNLVERRQLMVFRHKGFWQCMDTYRDWQYLNSLWKKEAPWKIWMD